MIWYKYEDPSDWVERWESEPVTLVAGLPQVVGDCAVIGFDDGWYWLNTEVHQVGTDNDFEMIGVVEIHAMGPQLTIGDPLDLLRRGRAVFSRLLEDKPAWLVDWYRCEIIKNEISPK